MQSENHHQDLEELSCHNISALAESTAQINSVYY